jgi:signal transduction histidine kinase
MIIKMRITLSIKKRIFTGLVILCFLAILCFTFAIKLSSDYLENLILTSNFQDELQAIKNSPKTANTWLPKSTHTLGFLASDGDVPNEFIKFDVGDYHEIAWNGKNYHLFVTPINSQNFKNDMLYVALQIDAIERYEEQLNIILLILAVNLMLASIWLAFWFTSLISKPISELSYNVSNLKTGEGKLTTSIEDTDLAPIENAINLYLHRINDHLQREKVFSGIASHELRTPISTIRSSLETFLADTKNKPLDEKQSLRIQRIQRASIEMQYITESLLYFIKQNIDDSHQQEPYELAPLLQEIIDEHLILKRNNTVNIIFSNSSNSTTTFKRELLKIIVGNLIRNALENTFSGQIEITLKNRIICIEDSGKGTPEDILKLLNKKPFQDIQHKKIGIGLFLVAKLCNQLHFNLHASNSKLHSTGTKMSIELPN